MWKRFVLSLEDSVVYLRLLGRVVLCMWLAAFEIDLALNIITLRGLWLRELEREV